MPNREKSSDTLGYVDDSTSRVQPLYLATLHGAQVMWNSKLSSSSATSLLLTTFSQHNTCLGH
jgi:hypothetical protein